MKHLVAEVGKLTLEPGDALVLTLGRKIASDTEREQIAKLPKYLSGRFAFHVPVIVLDPDMKLEGKKIAELRQVLDQAEGKPKGEPT